MVTQLVTRLIPKFNAAIGAYCVIRILRLTLQSSDKCAKFESIILKLEKGKQHLRQLFLMTQKIMESNITNILYISSKFREK